MEDVWRWKEQARSSREEKKCMQPGRMQPAFTVWWKNEKVVKNLSPSQKKKKDLREKARRGKETSDGVVCNSKQISVPEQGECQGPKWLREGSKHKLGRWSKSDLGGHDMVRRVDRHGDALIWCRNCSGYARQKNGT